MNNFKNTLIQITHEGMGSSDNILGVKLLSNYLTLLNNDNDLPKFIVFYNSGVKLVTEGSPLIDILKTIEAKGVKLIACKTCLTHFGLIDKQEVAIVGTMMDIIELQRKAERVINL